MQMGMLKPTNLNYYLAGFLIVPGLIMVYFGVKLLGKLDEETKYMEKIVRNY